MFKSFVASGLLALGLYGTAQYQGWSMFPSDAEEFKRVRAEQQYNRTIGRSGGGSSGHK